MDHNKLWKILKEMGIPKHLTCLLRNLYAGQEATVRTGHGTTDWLQIGKGVHQGCILSPCLKIAVKRREAKSKREKERYKHLTAEFQRIARRDKKAFLSDQSKKEKKTTEWERLEISSRKLEIPREHFMQRWTQ